MTRRPAPQPQAPDQPTHHPLQLLVSPIGQLSADGQLRELIQERRSRLGGDGGIWYLSPSTLAHHQLTNQPHHAEGNCHRNHEGVATLDASVAIWLQLRFGGIIRNVVLAKNWLGNHSESLPPPAPLAPLQNGADHGL